MTEHQRVAHAKRLANAVRELREREARELAAWLHSLPSGRPIMVTEHQRRLLYRKELSS